MIGSWIGRNRRPGVIEEVEAGRFAPARPRPPRVSLGRLASVLAARDNLIGVWPEADYEARTSSFRFLGRQIVLVNDPDDVKSVLATNHGTYERKSPQMRRALERLLGDGLFISDGATWARRRPLVADIVHKNRVPLFGQAMEDVASSLADRWLERGPATPIDLLAEMGELTAEIISRSVFGNALGKQAARQVIDGFATYQRHTDSVNLGYFLGADEGFPALAGPRMRRSIKQVHDVVEAVISAHLSGAGDGSSMIDLLVRRQARSPELELDIAALRNEAATIFMAGYETTASTLTWVWYLLAKAPWVEQRLVEELAEVVGDRPPTVADVPKLAWCRSIVEEALRLYPPVPILARQAGAQTRIGGIDVERAALVLIVPWLLHRSEALWRDAHAFKPERFLQARPAPYSYIPFSAGPRICAGLNFGLTEAILCLAILAQRVRITLSHGAVADPVCRLTLRPRTILHVYAEARR